MLKQKAKVPFRREQDGTAISITAYDSTKQEAHPQMRHPAQAGMTGERAAMVLRTRPGAPEQTGQTHCRVL
jgi:hypothetical protein